LLEVAKQQKATGQVMMKYLVLVAAWDGPNLADNLLSAVGTRVVELIHEAPPPTLKSAGSISVSH